MRNRDSFSTLLIIFSVFTLGCQLVASPAPHVPEVIATINSGGFGGSGGAVAANPHNQYIYVLHSMHVTVLKATERVAYLSTGGEEASYLAVDEVRDRVYVVNEGSDSVTVIRGTEVITQLKTVGRLPAAVAIEPKSGWAYMVSGHNQERTPGKDPVEGNILVISGDQVKHNIVLGRLLLTHVVADPVGGYIYAGDAGSTVVVIQGIHEVARYTEDKIGGVSRGLNAMDVNPRTGEVYALDGFGGVRRFKEGRLVDMMKIEKQGGVLRNLRVHPQTGDVYIVDWGLREVVVVRDMKEIARVKAGNGALKMTIDPLTGPLTGNVYVANYDDDTVTVIRGIEGLATLKIGLYPYGIGVNPVNGWVYVSNVNDGTVSVLGYPSAHATSTATNAPTKLPATPITPSGIPTQRSSIRLSFCRSWRLCCC